ncbi:MAG: phosphatase PAP2 family protein [Methylobacteriaceae bacterium]|nr:phosphatase PAP2 family protein [Methylobacteriaceae bacterium]
MSATIHRPGHGRRLAHELRQLLGHWRRPSREAPALPLAGVLAALFATALAVWFAGHFFDERLIRAARELPPGVVRLFALLTDIGTSGWMWLVGLPVAAFAMLARGQGRGARVDAGLLAIAQRALYLLATLAVSGLAAQIVKQIVGRGRPKLLDELGPFHFDAFALRSTYASFPSGHSTTAFAAAIALSFFLPRWRAPLLLLAIGIAVSRVVVGAHYPSDVIAGAFVGSLSALFVARAFARRGIAFVWRGDGLAVRGRRFAREAARALMSGSAARVA